MAPVPTLGAVGGPGRVDRPESGGPGSGGPAVAGVDGCRAGWVVARAVAGTGPPEVRSVEVHPTLDAVMERVDRAELAWVAVDMPIGLPAAGPRPCDAEARRLLGPRRSSVFPTPARVVLDATDYADALVRSRATIGSGLSRQSWNLVPRIAELDALLTASRCRTVLETHPELAFAVLAGAPLRHPKKTIAGRRERLRVLRPFVEDHWTRPAAVPRGAGGDDVLDALVLAVRAAQWATGAVPAVVTGGTDRDDRGRPMQIRG